MSVRDLMPWSRSRAPAPVTSDPLLQSFANLQREVDRMFEDMWRSMSGFGVPMRRIGDGILGTAWPSVDVSETDNEIRVTAELPGLEEKDVEVMLQDGALILKGEKRAETEEKDQNYVYTERSFGAFQRAIPINAEVQEDKVQATFKNGVLTVILPKSPEASRKAKRIAITAQ